MQGALLIHFGMVFTRLDQSLIMQYTWIKEDSKTSATSKKINKHIDVAAETIADKQAIEIK